MFNGCIRAVGGIISRRNGYGFGLLCCLSILNPNPVFAQQPSANSTGTLPGASQPQSNQWQLKEQTDGELYIPPKSERVTEEDEGPGIKLTSISLYIHPQLQRLIDDKLKNELDLILTSRVKQNAAQGFTIGRLENLAADITDTLREAGFILAWAYLPEQTVQNDTIRIHVLQGSLYAVTVDGNTSYSTSMLIQPFSDLIGTPVQRTMIENSIMQIRNFPGLSTSAVFGPGEELGTSQLTLRVDENPFEVSVTTDNFGSESTGEYRVRSDLYWNNPFGRGDRLTVNLLQTFDPAENFYGGIAYQSPLIRPDLTLSLGYSNNVYEVASGLAAGAGVGGVNLTGDTSIGSIGLSKNLELTRRSRMDMGFDLSVKNAVLDNLPFVAEDNLTVASFFFAVESADELGSGGINQFDIRFAKGIPDFLGSMTEDGDDGRSTRIGASGQNAGGDFAKLTLRYQRLQRIAERHSLLLRAEGQVSDDLLTSLEQFVLGGPYNVRAYPIAEYLVDEGTFASFEWIIDVGKRDSNTSVSISVFSDFAYGKINEPLANEIDDIDLSGWGVGISITHTGQGGDQLALRLDVATPITDDEPSDGDDPNIYGQISYLFQ